MYCHFQSLGLISLTLLLSTGIPILPTGFNLTPQLAQAQTTGDREAEADKLAEQGKQQQENEQWQAAIATYKQALTIYQSLGRREREGFILWRLGMIYERLENYSEALQSYQASLAIDRELKNSENESVTLKDIGDVYSALREYPKALEFYQQALTIDRQLKERKSEGLTLWKIGLIYEKLYQFERAIAYFQESLVIDRELGNREDEAITLMSIGSIYDDIGQYERALDYYQQALVIRREIDDRKGEGTTLNNLGLVYDNLGKYEQALDYYRQALTIGREVGDRSGEGGTLNNIGEVYRNLGKYEQALDYYRQALAIIQEVGDRFGEGTILNNIGAVYNSLGKYEQALNYYRQALAISKEIGDRGTEGTTLNNIGAVYDSLGKYEQALDYYRQALAIYKEVGDRSGEVTTLNNIGAVYDSLGKYEQALDYYRQALAIIKEIGDHSGEGITLNNIGGVYYSLGKYEQALDYYRQALAISKEIGDRSGEGTTLIGIGTVYRSLGKYEQALDYLQQALAIIKEVGYRPMEGTTLNNIGLVYDNLGKYEQSLDYYRQALAILQEVGDRSVEATTLHNIGYVLESQNQPELAIIFFKSSVITYENIRADILTLPKEEQESYLKTVEGTYRKLADLLLSQGRILEAQQVLELLKVQEIRDFTNDTRAGGDTTSDITNPTEREILEIHGTLIALGQKIVECQKCAERSQLLDRRDVISKEFEETVRSLEAEIEKRRADDKAFLDPSTLGGQAEEIVSAQAGTVLIYPIVLEDKIWILWVAQGGITKSIEVPQTNLKQLSATVIKFRQLLQDPRSDVKELQATGKQLYDWLFPASLQKELKDNKIQNLIFSLDSVTRYIPMSALYDGERYLVENYTLSTIISAELTDTRDRLPPGTDNTSVLALGLSNAVSGFNSLPNVVAELDVIVKESEADPQGIYSGLAFLNKAFDDKALRDNLAGHIILHIATHGEFVPGDKDASYLLLGDGNPITIHKIKELRDLSGVHLVVLSACETALGETGQDGKEIAGISYYFLEKGVKAVMASLWKVNDKSTETLMRQFYGNLSKSTAQSPITKAQALRQAQLSLIQGKQTRIDDGERGLRVESRQEGQPSTNDATPFSHPFYWAAFILIGNGL